MNTMIKRVILLVMLIILFHQCCALVIGVGSDKSKELKVTTVRDYKNGGKFSIERNISFCDKKYLGLGRYGFIKKIRLDKAATIEQDLIGPKYSPLVSFGIYYDRTLLSPVEDVSKYKDLKEDVAMEYGEGDGATEDNIIVKLKPGTYYAAVYSLNPFSCSDYKYILHKRTPIIKRSISENELVYYDVDSAKQTNRFKVSLTKGHKEVIVGHECKSVLIENDKGNIVFKKNYENLTNDDKKVQLEILNGGNYYISLRYYARTYSEEPMKFVIKKVVR